MPAHFAKLDRLNHSWQKLLRVISNYQEAYPELKPREP